MRVFSGLVLGILLALGMTAVAAPKSLPPPTVRPAIDGILAAFATHPLVALGNSEGNAQQEDFYAALMRDPRFARDVGNVVVEFGSAADQGILDRYLNGEDVKFTDLRKVWSDLVGYNFPADLGLVNFFVTVRDVNRSLPPDQRIHVWGGEPPIDWSKVQEPKDFFQFMGQRDTWPAGIIENEILAKNKKALVIYGAGHFYQRPGGGYMSVIPLVEQKHPGAVFKIEMYFGFVTKSCADSFEKSIRTWPTPALAMPIRGTSLEGRLYRPDCDAVPRSRSFVMFSDTTAAPKVRMKVPLTADNERSISGVNADALLFVGKSASLTQSPMEPSIYLDPDYLREMNRHAKLGADMEWGGKPLDTPLTESLVKQNPTAPRYTHPY